MKFAETKQIKTVGNFVIWYSLGDEYPWWVSDLDGAEIDAFITKKQCENWIKKNSRLCVL